MSIRTGTKLKGIQAMHLFIEVENKAEGVVVRSLFLAPRYKPMTFFYFFRRKSFLDYPTNHQRRLFLVLTPSKNR
jgi:hypothetical protein